MSYRILEAKVYVLLRVFVLLPKTHNDGLALIFKKKSFNKKFMSLLISWRMHASFAALSES